MRPACEATYSDFLPLCGMVRTSICGTGGSRLASSAVNSVNPLLRREVAMQCSATRPSSFCFVAAGSAS